jgi:hypothetical protein
MDTFDLFKNNGTGAAVKASLDARYPDPSCAAFST